MLSDYKNIKGILNVIVEISCGNNKRRKTQTFDRGTPETSFENVYVQHTSLV